MKNYAWIQFTCPPSFITFTYIDYLWLSGGWNEGSFMRSSERLEWDFMRSNNFGPGDLVPFFNELDTRQGTLLRFIVSFLTNLAQEKELYSGTCFIS